MYALPVGTDLSQEQRQELDDTFLSSDPFGYFTTRIAMMLRWASDSRVGDPRALDEGVSAFGLYLGQPRLHLDVSANTVALQLATDAFALRQHAAESLLRLVSAVLDHAEMPDRSLWECVSDGPYQLDELVKSSSRRLTDDRYPGLGDLVIRDDDRAPERVNQLMDRLLVFDSWYRFAESLATDTIHGFHTANNKLKHGPAVRARGDVLAKFTNVNPERSPGEIELSALTGPGAFDLINETLIEVLAQAPKSRHRVWEVTQIPVDTDLLLSEAYMIAWTHAAIFTNAALRHFQGRDLEQGFGAPAFPGYPNSAITPHRPHFEHRLQSFRIPLTVAPGSSASDAKHVFGYRSHWIPATFGPPSRGVIVDNSNPNT